MKGLMGISFVSKLFFFNKNFFFQYLTYSFGWIIKNRRYLCLNIVFVSVGYFGEECLLY